MIAALYLWNPMTIATCVSGEWASLEVAAVLGAACLAAVHNSAGAAACFVIAAYLSLHHVLLLVRKHMCNSGKPGYREGVGLTCDGFPSGVWRGVSQCIRGRMA